MLKTYMENNVIFTEYRNFDSIKELLRYVDELSSVYRTKEEELYFNISPKNCQLHIKIVKHNMWIGVFSKN